MPLLRISSSANGRSIGFATALRGGERPDDVICARVKIAPADARKILASIAVGKTSGECENVRWSIVEPVLGRPHSSCDVRPQSLGGRA